MTYHHLSVLVHRQAEKYGDKVALKYRDYETAQWIPISWKQFSGSVRQAANAFVALGVEEQENIGIFSQNKPEWFYVDFGAFANRAVTIPFYATSSPAQAQYIINDAQIRFLFVGEQYQYDAAFSIFGFCTSLQQLIIFDRSVVKDPRDVSSIYFDEFMAMGEEVHRYILIRHGRQTVIMCMKLFQITGMMKHDALRFTRCAGCIENVCQVIV